MFELVLSSIHILFSIFFLLIVSYAVIVSFREREYYAAGRIALFSGLLLLFFILMIIFDFPGKKYLVLSLLSLVTIVSLLIFIPFKKKYNIEHKDKYDRIDERDTMFSRIRLKEGTELYEEYYSKNPEKKYRDDKRRALPGLLSKASKYYNELIYPATDAIFYVSDHLKSIVDEEKLLANERQNIEISEFVKFIKGWSKKAGMHSIGITYLQKHHLYTYMGRDDRYGRAVETNHKYAIAFTVEMEKDLIDTAPDAPTIMESASQYVNSGLFAVMLARYIRSFGYSARAHIDGNYQLICPLVASDAGLGVIGRMGLLMTPRLGPRVRIGVVTTDMELPVDKKQFDHSTVEFCRICKKCAEACPSQAISYEDMKKTNDIARWQIDSDMCYDYWCKAGTDCGHCIMVCPYSHPDNLMHNFVRFGIRNNFIFAKAALKLDDFLYKRKPKQKPPPKWLK